MPTLQLLNGPRAGLRWPVLGNRFVIGRADTCDVVLKDPPGGTSRREPSVSRKQALITFADDQWFIEDGDGDGKKSHNGTKVNDKELPYPGRVRLRDQDRIRICDIQFAFLLDPESTFTVEASVGHSDSGVSLDRQPAARLRLLLDVSAALRGTLDADAVLDRTLEHLFKMFPQAERGLVVFREDPSASLVVRSIRTPHGGPADPRFSTSVVRRCLESMEAVLGNDLRVEFPGSDSLGILPSRSLMCTPLWTQGGRTLGAIQLDASTDKRKFTPDDLSLFLGVANQASIALSNARLHYKTMILHRKTRDLEVAQQVQRALLPLNNPEVPQYEFFAYYKPAEEVGGDYYDFVPLPDGRLAILLGDVTGHGIPAALVMAKFSVEARVCLESNSNPAAAVDRLNAVMMRSLLPGTFVTLVVAVLDPATHAVVVVNAGHPSPLLVRASGEVEEAAPPDVAGLPIGIDDRERYGSGEVRLEPGDRLVMFSDGITEAMDANDAKFDVEGIRAALRGGDSAKGTGERLLQAAKEHAAGCEQFDDVTLVCFRRQGDSMSANHAIPFRR